MKISLPRRQALTVADGAFSHKIDYIIIFKEILNPEGHPNRITGYGNVAEWVDFSHWLSFIRKGLLLLPAQQACFVSVLLSTHIERFSVSLMSGFGIGSLKNYPVLTFYWFFSGLALSLVLFHVDRFVWFNQTQSIFRQLWVLRNSETKNIS